MDAKSSGIDLWTSLGVEALQDLFSVLIPRHSQIPKKKAGNFCTTFDYESQACLKVYQGERL